MSLRVYNQVSSRQKIPLLIKQQSNPPVSPSSLPSINLHSDHLVSNHFLIIHLTKCSQWQCHHSRDLPLPSQTIRPLLAQSSKNTSWTLKTSKTSMQFQSHLQSHLQSLPHHRKYSRLSYQVSQFHASFDDKNWLTDVFKGLSYPKRKLSQILVPEVDFEFEFPSLENVFPS
jgi:hypothetical protein